MDKNLVSASPHIVSPINTKNIMADVIIALMPTTLASILIFGLYPMVVIIFAIIGSMGGEYIFSKMTKTQHTLGDCSAILTGLLLGLNLPPVIPFYVPLIGGLFATLVVKMLFGGLGKNFANPAITARIFLLLAWGGLMTTYVKPIDLNNGIMELFRYFGSNVDGITSATPLASIGAGTYDNIPLLNMFLGLKAGSSGEVCSLALIIGGLYLVIKRVIEPLVPILFVGTTALCMLIFTGDINAVLPSILSGGLLLGAIFMATDYATSPNTRLGQFIFAIGCGLLTAIIRQFSNLPEGVSFAILLMNIITPLLDKYIVPKPFGYQKTIKRFAKKEQPKLEGGEKK